MQGVSNNDKDNKKYLLSCLFAVAEWVRRYEVQFSVGARLLYLAEAATGF